MNQIEEIKKEIEVLYDKSAYGERIPKQFIFEILDKHNNQPDYKSAFINAKERLEDFNDYDFIEELESEYNLGGE